MGDALILQWLLTLPQFLLLVAGLQLLAAGVYFPLWADLLERVLSDNINATVP